jgi:hypothetical protein
VNARQTKAQPEPARDIIAAINDERLFRPWFEGESWDRWRAVLKSAYALPMTDSEVEFFRSIAERDPPKRRVRELWVIAGRRAGKDSVASLICAFSGAMFDQQDRLRPGERALVACLANDKDQARIVLDYTRAYFAESPLLRQLVSKDERANDFQLANRVDISVLTSNYRSVRGRPILCAVLDELAFWRDESSANPDEETYRALVPGLASLDGMLIAISSPYRRSGLLYSKFKKHFGRDDDDVLVVRAPTRMLNPTIPQEIVDRALAEDRAAAEAEWNAQFRSDITGWLAIEVIEAAVDRGVTVRPPRRNHDYCGFVDPSGGAKDSFTCAIAHLEENDVAVLDALLEIPAPFDPDSATQEVCQLLASYGLKDAIGDRYGAAWVVSAFDRHSVYYKHSERDRSAIYSDTLPLFTSGRVRLLDSPRLISQFASLERKTSSLGRDKVDHGPGGHDDLCNAAAGALVNATNADMYTLTSEPLWQAFARSAGEDEPSKEENLREAVAEAAAGNLDRKSLYWLKLEQRRIARRQMTQGIKG